MTTHVHDVSRNREEKAPTQKLTYDDEAFGVDVKAVGQHKVFIWSDPPVARVQQANVNGPRRQECTLSFSSKLD